MKIHALILVLASAVATAAHAASLDDPATYGESSPSTTVARIINLTPETRFINVSNGETITFNKGTESFTWHVDTYSNISKFSLAKIAPKDFQLGDIDVYVAPD